MFSRLGLIQHWAQLFAEQGLDSPRLSAQVLLAHVLSLPRLELLLAGQELVSIKEQARFEALARQRLLGQPIAYLLGVREFYGLEFYVSPEVLIPRPETELIIDFLRQDFSPDAALNILDIGTGSGILAITSACFFPQAKIVAIDLSWSALQVARQNILKHKVEQQVLAVQGDLIWPCACENADIILTNLPYVPEKTKNSLSPEVVLYEPSQALFAGHDGLDVYRRLLPLLKSQVKPGTHLFCEIDASQGQAMYDLFQPWATQVEIRTDYAGLERIVFVVF